MRLTKLVVPIALVVMVTGCSDAADSDAETTTTEVSTTTVAWSDVPASSDTVMVYGSWTESDSRLVNEGSTDGVHFVVLDYSEVLEMSDPRASGTMEYSATLYVPDTSIGGTSVVEDASIVNDGGRWVGYEVGAYIYANNMPDALTTREVVIIGEWHLTGTGEYEGLRLDLYSSSDGVIGSIRPTG